MYIQQLACVMLVQIGVNKYIVDPGTIEIDDQQFEYFKGPATVQVPLLVDHLISKAKNS
jgi:hypothetical protein